MKTTTTHGPEGNLDTTTINTGYGRRKWVFGTIAELADDCHSRHSGRYENHDEAWAAANEYWSGLDDDDRAAIVRANQV